MVVTDEGTDTGGKQLHLLKKKLVNTLNGCTTNENKHGKKPCNEFEL